MFTIIRKCCYCLLLFFTATYTFSQTTLQYPVSFSQFFNQYSLLNPAATAVDTRASFRSGEQVHAGYYSRVRSFFATADYSLKKDLTHARQGLGVSFMNSKEGSVFSFNRAYLQYAYHLPVSDHLNISAGASLGFLNFHADNTSTSGTISTFAPDGSIGLLISSEKHRLGISSAQIFNKTILVSIERIHINRFYRFYYSGRLRISSTVAFLPMVLYTLKKERSELDLNTSFLIRELIMFGVSYRYQRGTSYFFGLRDLQFMGGQTSMMVSYNAPWPSSTLGNIQSFEVVLSYALK